MSFRSDKVLPRNGWNHMIYKIGKWSKFKFDIAFFRGAYFSLTGLGF